MFEKRIRLVFDAMQESEVACLLMGGQACVLYGAAEFSKDVDFVVLADSVNLHRVQKAMDSLQAETIAVPPFDPELLKEGLAVHFRCQAPVVEGMRVDVMTKMRGVDDFPLLWKRRFTVEDGEGGVVNLLGVRDLVAAKKTQRDKDWPMIQRLMEVRYLSAADNPASDEISFWLQELRTPELLIDAAQRFKREAANEARNRPLLDFAIHGNSEALIRGLVEEMIEEKERDRRHWEPLKARLGELRRASARAKQ